MLPILKQKKRQNLINPKKGHTNSRKSGIGYRSKAQGHFRLGKKGKIKKYSQPKLGSYTDAEAMASDSENPHIQSCDEDLLDMSSNKRRYASKNKKKSNTRRLKEIQSFKSETGKFEGRFKGSRSDFFEIYKKNAEDDTKIMKKKMRTLKEVEQTLKFINQGKEEIEGYVRGRGSLESQRRKREMVRLPRNNRSHIDLREQSKMSKRMSNAVRQRRLSREDIQDLIEKERERSDLLRKKMALRGKQGDLRMSKLSSPGEGESLSRLSKNPRLEHTNHHKNSNKQKNKPINFDNLRKKSKNFFKKNFDNPLKFPSFGPADKTIGDSPAERLSLPVRKKKKSARAKNSRSSVSRGLTPLIRQSPTLKLIRHANHMSQVEKVNKKTFEEFIKSQREKRNDIDNEQRSESVDSGLENAESLENACTTGFGLRTIPGKKNGVRKVNQDSAFYETCVLGFQNLALFGVFDGHGPQGHRVSRFLINNLLGKLIVP